MKALDHQDHRTKNKNMPHIKLSPSIQPSGALQQRDRQNLKDILLSPIYKVNELFTSDRVLVKQASIRSYGSDPSTDNDRKLPKKSNWWHNLIHTTTTEYTKEGRKVIICMVVENIKTKAQKKKRDKKANIHKSKI